jgi:DNA-binding transcriptional ArsR family regulator
MLAEAQRSLPHAGAAGAPAQHPAGDVDIAAVAALLADPARAAILTALLDGRALPAGELARTAHIAPSTASAHLARLLASGFLSVECWGRHRYYRIVSVELIQAMEALAVAAPPAPIRSLRQSQTAAALRYARTCYDHLAGCVGVALTQALIEAKWLVEGESGYHIPAEGRERFIAFGLDLPSLRQRHTPLFAPWHVDWSERRHHLAGPLAVGVTTRLFERGWLVRMPMSRAVRLTDAGRTGVGEWCGMQM